MRQIHLAVWLSTFVVGVLLLDPNNVGAQDVFRHPEGVYSFYYPTDWAPQPSRFIDRFKIISPNYEVDCSTGADLVPGAYTRTEEEAIGEVSRKIVSMLPKSFETPIVWQNGLVRITTFLEGQGYKVLRFWNNDVLGNTDGVYITIADVLRRHHPHPTLPPQGGGLIDSSEL